MKIALLFSCIFSLLLTSALSVEPPRPDPRSAEVAGDSKDIKLTQEGNSILIELHTGGIAGRRVVQTEVQSFSNYPFVTLTYQIVQNFDKSFRHVENFSVVWKIPKDEYAKLRKERKFYILRKDDVFLSAQEILEL